MCLYTPEGRKGLHDNLKVDMGILIKLMNTPLKGNSIEYFDNRLSLYSAQHGKCWATQRVFTNTEDIHCHHKIPKKRNGTDKYENLVLVHSTAHKLIHATQKDFPLPVEPTIAACL